MKCNHQYQRFLWKTAGLAYFICVFLLVPACASAYIDPSVTSYAIQAIAGVAVALGAFFAAYGRKMKKNLLRFLDMDADQKTVSEQEVAVLDNDLAEVLESRKKRFQENTTDTDKGKTTRKCHHIGLSLICGFTPAIVYILQPILFIYQVNEASFWFRLTSVLPYILLISVAITVAVAGIHFTLPERKINIRLFFMGIVAACSLCGFIQNHFLSSYLPVITGSPIDWSQYSGWNIAGIVIWAGIFFFFILLCFLRPRILKVVSFLTFVFILLIDGILCCISLGALKGKNSIETCFSEKGIYETAEKGNIVVFIVDTFEGTYMNSILEEYPEYKEMLSDVTYYDNVSGASIYTYFSYAKMLSGLDFPMGYTLEDGISYCFDHQTVLDRINANGWDISYYTTFVPSESIKDKVKNYLDYEVEPNQTAARTLTKYLVKSGLFRCVPQPFKDKFLAFTFQYEEVKGLLGDQSPYFENDTRYYHQLKEKTLEVTDGNPRYSLIQLFGAHEPVEINADFQPYIYNDSVSYEERRETAARAHLLLLRTYLDQLKAAGTYDDTTVIMTADHGFTMRLYPVMLVKEAHRKETGFRVDHSPISVEEDYEPLMVSMTSGKSFSEALEDLPLSEDRERRAYIFYSSEGYTKKTDSRSLVLIRGDAKEEDSYYVEQDDILLDNPASAYNKMNAPFILNTPWNVEVYGRVGNSGDAIGHSVLFDTFFDQTRERDISMKMSVQNLTSFPQRMRFVENDELIQEVTIPADGMDHELLVVIPAKGENHITIRVNLPDARIQDNSQEWGLRWNDYYSIRIKQTELSEGQ